jgi:hypothetical protein
VLTLVYSLASTIPGIARSDWESFEDIPGDFQEF